MLVYRVETPSGVGPFSMKGLDMSYSDDAAYCDIIHEHLKADSHPAPPHRLIAPEYHFGCDSMEALRTWFNQGMIELLQKYGYVVKIFKIKIVEPVSIGQVAFKFNNAVEVETHPLSILA